MYNLHSICMFSEILNKVCVKTLKTIVGTVKILMEIMQIRLWKSIRNKVHASLSLCKPGCVCAYTLPPLVSLNFHSYKEKFDASFKYFYYFWKIA